MTPFFLQKRKGAYPFYDITYTLIYLLSFNQHINQYLFLSIQIFRIVLHLEKEF